MMNTNYQTANSVHELFRKLPKSTIEWIGRQMRRLAPASGLTYTDDHGKTAVITLTLRPRVIDRKKRDSLWRTIRSLDHAFLKLARLYAEHPKLHELFPFEPRELDWMSLLREPDYLAGRIASRWDANTTFGDQDWKEGYSFFEINGVGVGGMWYGPACAELAMKIVVPELQKIDPKFRPAFNHNASRLLLDLLNAQRKKIARTRGAVALAMEKASGSNFIEFERLAKLYTKMGFPTIVAEPTDFVFKKEVIFARGKKIDVIYRDTTLEEFCALEEKGTDLTALREGFRKGQIISSLEGELDHKSAFEVFTSSEYDEFFTEHERALFRRHILWTRLVRETKTQDPRLRTVDLIPFILKCQSELVLKPNRLYGGKGIVFGRDVPQKVWSQKIETAIRERGDWVIQQLGKLRTKRFFRPDRARAKEKDLYVVSGFFATENGLAIVGRMSERTIVNVAQRGGLTPVLLI